MFSYGVASTSGREAMVSLTERAMKAARPPSRG